jgi:RNA polymerase sigma-70 factor (ECF subfamily)
MEVMGGKSLFAPLYRRYQTVRDQTEDRDLEADRVKRAQDGDASVWGEWFEAYYKPLFRYAYIRLHSKADAEDIVAQVFVEAFRGIGRYTYAGKPLLAWLYRIAHNLTFDKQTARARELDYVAGEDGIALDQELEVRIANIDLKRAIDALAEEQRDVIVMRYFFAMSAQEAADLIGKTPTAVFSLQARALVHLKHSLREAAK